MMILILGGSGSGKSAYAEDYLLRTAGDKKKYYIATMQIWDEEMQAKVARHHRLRQGKGFTTIEQPTALANSLSCFHLMRGCLPNGAGGGSIAGMYVESCGQRNVFQGAACGS